MRTGKLLIVVKRTGNYVLIVVVFNLFRVNGCYESGLVQVLRCGKFLHRRLFLVTQYKCTFSLLASSITYGISVCFTFLRSSIRGEDVKRFIKNIETR